MTIDKADAVHKPRIKQTATTNFNTDISKEMNWGLEVAFLIQILLESCTALSAHHINVILFTPRPVCLSLLQNMSMQTKAATTGFDCSVPSAALLSVHSL